MAAKGNFPSVKCVFTLSIDLGPVVQSWSSINPRLKFNTCTVGVYEFQNIPFF